MQKDRRCPVEKGKNHNRKFKNLLTNSKEVTKKKITGAL